MTMKLLDWIIVLTSFTSLILLTNLLKYLLSHGFPYPLFCSASHMMTAFVFASIYIDILGLVPDFRILDVKTQSQYIWPIALAHASSIGLTNIGVNYLFPSFVSMISTTQPIFTLIIGLLLATEKFNKWSYIAMVPIIIGTILQCWGETTFDGFGLVCVLGGCAMRAVKQVLQAKLLCGSLDMHPMALLYYVAPWSFLMFMVWSLIVEGKQPIFVLLDSEFKVRVIFLVGAVVAGGYNIIAFLAVKRMNATLWSLLGQLNTPAISFVSYQMFGNEIKLVQMQAFVLSSVGVYIYNSRGRVALEDKKDIKFSPVNPDTYGQPDEETGNHLKDFVLEEDTLDASDEETENFV
eukprot:GEMP01036334.1.p1 GENE.GEMP01036334.1~~GEMP01036334.1.p1  ORF type:complete len:350 (+),score=27.78 GEMP01036334.1:29-1078(+)